MTAFIRRHLYDQKVQERVVTLGLTTADEIRKEEK